jgi:hypothetical protein
VIRDLLMGFKPKVRKRSKPVKESETGNSAPRKEGIKQEQRRVLKNK